MSELFFKLVLELGLVAKCKLLSLAVSSKEQYMPLLPSPLSSMPSFGSLCIVCGLLQLYNVVILIFILIRWKIITCP